MADTCFGLVERRRAIEIYEGVANVAAIFWAELLQVCGRYEVREAWYVVFRGGVSSGSG